MSTGTPTTRIQKERSAEILSAALSAFSRHGFRGASLNGIAADAGMSTPRLLYYFDGKEALYREVLRRTILLWIEPLEGIDPAGEPVDEICAYVRRKLELSQAHPEASRLFASEIIAGIPRARDEIFAPLRAVFDAKIALIASWGRSGRIAAHDPHHLMYAIWATTQHYADFEAQIAELSPQKTAALYEEAEAFLVPLYRRLLTPAAP